MATPHPWGPDLHIEWRVHVCCWAAQQASRLAADYVECGVFTGILSAAVMKYIEFEKMTDRRFYLLDTFDGIPAKQLTEQEVALGILDHNSFYFDCYEAARRTFAAYPNAVIIKGMAQETVAQVKSERIGYLSIDMNAVEPEMAAAEYFWPRLADGAVVVLDDYGWKTHIHQKHAWDAFAARVGTEVLSMPTGQGLIVKRNA